MAHGRLGRYRIYEGMSWFAACLGPCSTGVVMETISEQLRERAARAQAAIVRALFEELKHLPPGSGAAADLRMQLAEEFGRLALYPGEDV